MKKKILLVVSLVVVGLAILTLFSGQIAGYLGVEPICIQGDLAQLRLGPCSSFPESSSSDTIRPFATLSIEDPIPLIFDDDGSPDGMIALLYFLNHPTYEVRAITVSCGEAHPGIFADHLNRFLAGIGHSDIPIGAGRETPLEGQNTFPEPWRQLSDSFWDLSYPQTQKSSDPQSASKLIIDTLSKSAEPMLVYLSGTHTNLAEALLLAPEIASKIDNVFIMGGSINRPGNIESDWPEIRNSVAEWNIWVDPVAASVVFNAGLPIYLVPLDATNQVLWTKADSRQWDSSGTTSGKWAAEILNWTLDSWSTKNVYVWDLVAAALTADPDLCPAVPLSVDVLVDPGPEQGRTILVDRPSNATVCLEPDARKIKEYVAYIFGQ